MRYANATLKLELIMLHVLHDFLLVRGGAERLVLTLAEGLQAPLICGFHAGKSADWESSAEIRTLGTAVPGQLKRYLFTAHRFAHLSPDQLSEQINIYSGVLAPLAVKNQRAGRRIHYCHSPPRFLYDLQDFYLERMGFAGRIGLKIFNAWLQPRYEESIKAMDLVIANSQNVARRLRRYLNVDSIVIAPPINTERFSWLEDGNYFLSLARLEDYKRVDLIIEAFRRMPQQNLIIASGGSKESELRRLASDCANIRFTSWIDDAALADLIGRCRAAIYMPRDEDFGMSPLEAMAAGKPVIGVAEGGLLETVVNEVTGKLLAPDPSVDELIAAVESFTSSRARDMKQACEQHAQKFSRSVFLERMQQVV